MPTYLLYINSWLFRFGRLANDVTITVISEMPRRHKKECSQFDGRYSYIQRYLRAKLGAYRTVCGISGVHNGEAAEFPIHTSLIHAFGLTKFVAE